jgi:hypothetical protein
MPTLDKKSLSEQDIRSKFITPALVSANRNWIAITQSDPICCGATWWCKGHETGTQRFS